MAALSVDKSLLDQFWKLSDNKDANRIEAAIKILKYINFNQNDVINKGNGVQADGAGEDESKPAEEETVFEYVLKRLIRGLASERQSSRQGFFMCLVQVLKSASMGKTEVCEKVMELTDNLLSTAGSKAEEGSLCCGRIMAMAALLRSAVVTSSSDSLPTVIDKIVKSSRKRSYLVQLADHLIIDFITSVEDQEVFSAKVWPALTQSYSWGSEEEALSLESVWVLLQVHTTFPSVISKSFVKEAFKRKKFIDDELARTVADLVMKGSTPVRSLHEGPVLKGIIKTLCGTNLALTLWTKHISPNIQKASCYKTTAAFVILDLILANLSDKKKAPLLLQADGSTGIVGVIHHLFSKSMVRPEDRALIMCLLERVVGIAKEEPSTQPEFLKALMSGSNGGSVAFDKVTGSGTVLKILALMTDAEVVKATAGYFKAAVTGHPISEGENHIYTTQERIYSAHQLSKLTSHAATQSELEWKQEILNFLLASTLFNLKKPFETVTKAPLAFSKELQKETKDVFFKAMDLKAKNFEAMCRILIGTMEFACRLLKDSGLGGAANTLHPMSDASRSEWDKVVKVVREMEKSGGDQGNEGKVKREDRIFQVLFIYVGFQLLTAAQDEAVESLKDLHVCRAKSLEKKPKKKSKKKAAAAEDGDEEEEPRWAEVVVDLLLSLLSQDRHALRQVVRSVTSLLCPHMTNNALQSVMDVVGGKDEEDSDDEGAEDDDDDGGEFEPIGEGEAEEGKERDDEDMQDEESDEDSESEDEGQDDEGKEVDQDFRNKVKAALGDAVADDAMSEGGASIDMDDLDDEDMDRSGQ